MHQRSAGKFGPRRCFMVWNSTRQFVAMKFTWGGPVVEPPTHLFKLKQLKTGKATRGVMKALQVRMVASGAQAFMVCSIRLDSAGAGYTAYVAGRGSRPFRFASLKSSRHNCVLNWIAGLTT